MKKLNFIFYSLLLTPYSFAPKVFGASGSFSVNIGDETQSRVAINTDLGSFVSNTISAVILVAGLATLMYLIYGGIQWTTSGGDKGKLEEARGKLTNGVIGLTIVVSAWAVYLLIDYFFGIGLTK